MLENDFDRVLFIGPNHKNYKGGIGAILHTYKNSIPTFRFISTYNYFSADILNILYFVKQLFLITNTLLFYPGLKIVHIHSSHKGSFFRKSVVILISKIFFRKKVIFHSNSSRFNSFYAKSTPLIKKYIQFVLNKTDLILAVSKSWNTFFKEITSNKSILSLNNIIINPGVTRKYDSAFERKPITLLFLGRVGERKGVFDLLQVILENRKNWENKIRLVVGGDGEIDRLQNEIHEHDLQTMVSFVGWISDVEKKECLLQSDLYILPSYDEGLPISILEAMSYGLPVISTYAGGIPELIRPEYNGLLFNAGNLNEMKDAIQSFIDNPGKIKDMGMGATESVKDFYPEEVFSSLSQIYGDLLKA